MSKRRSIFDSGLPAGHFYIKKVAEYRAAANARYWCRRSLATYMLMQPEVAQVDDLFGSACYCLDRPD